MSPSDSCGLDLVVSRFLAECELCLLRRVARIKSIGLMIELCLLCFYRYYAEFLVTGTTFLFREGRAKGIGKVTELLG